MRRCGVFVITAQFINVGKRQDIGRYYFWVKSSRHGQSKLASNLIAILTSIAVYENKLINNTSIAVNVDHVTNKTNVK